jgi:hypothetical protein
MEYVNLRSRKEKTERTHECRRNPDRLYVCLFKQWPSAARVRQRTHEDGLRMVLGCTTSEGCLIGHQVTAGRPQKTVALQ